MTSNQLELAENNIKSLKTNIIKNVIDEKKKNN